MRRLRRRDGAALAWALAAGCGAGAFVALPAAAVPSGADERAWARARLREGLPGFVDALTSRGAEALRALRLRDVEVRSWLNETGQRRARESMTGVAPSSRERRMVALHHWRGSTVTGFCARGVRIVEGDGPEGFAQRTLVVDRVLVVAARSGATWAMWCEGLVWAPGGWRVLPWVPYATVVEAPRRDHFDAQVWDCDVADRDVAR